MQKKFFLTLLFLFLPGMFLVELVAQSPAAPATSSVRMNSLLGDEFALPREASPEELLALAQRLMTTEKSFAKEEEYTVWLRKMFATVLEIADRILVGNVEDRYYFNACGLKGQVLAYMATTDPTFRASFDEFIQGLEVDPRIQQNEQGKLMTLSFRAIFWQDKVATVVRQGGNLEEFEKTIKGVQLFIIQNPMMADMVFELVYPINLVAEMNQKPEMVGEMLGRLYRILKDSAAPEHQKVAQALEGTLRFAALKGNDLRLEGRHLNETLFDSSTLRGKVVLLDFWATWCVPCQMIYPELLALYQKYKNQGFEIVGYSIDSDLAQLRKYITDSNIPWPILSEAIAKEKKELSLQEYYGITGVPTLVLVGRDGKVLSQYLDIDSLKTMVEEQFK